MNYKKSQKIIDWAKIHDNEIVDALDEKSLDNIQDYELGKEEYKHDEDVMDMITEHDAEDYLVDNIDDGKDVYDVINDDIDINNTNDQDIDIEEIEIEEEVPDFGNTEQAFIWAIDNNKVVRINYHTQGKTRRNGRKLKREMGLLPGSDIVRIIEPHHIFTAGTGNRILVAYDRSIRDIRAFIIDNIINYIFTDKEFKKRLRVLPNKKRITDMDNKIFEDLNAIGNKLDSLNMKKTSSQITKVMKSLLDIKKAQYVGVQGYAIRNRRCWDNCYRQKRTKFPSKTAQNIWMECWDEYQKSINDNNSGWEKYAEEKVDKQVKTSFSKDVSVKVSQGQFVADAIYNTIAEKEKEVNREVFRISKDLSDIALRLNDKQPKIASKIAGVSVDLIKEAEFGNSFWNNVFTGKWSKKSRILDRLSNISKRIQRLIQLYQYKGRYASSERISKESQILGPDGRPWGNPQNTENQTQQENVPQSQNKQQDLYKKMVRTEYAQFVSDLRKEVSYLNNMASKEDPKSKPYAIKAIDGIYDFLNAHDKSYQTGNFNFETMMPHLKNLSTTVSKVMSGIDVSSDGVADGDTVPQKPQNNQKQDVQNNPNININNINMESIKEKIITGNPVEDAEIQKIKNEIKYLNGLLNSALSQRKQNVGQFA